MSKYEELSAKVAEFLGNRKVYGCTKDYCAEGDISLCPACRWGELQPPKPYSSDAHLATDLIDGKTKLSVYSLSYWKEGVHLSYQWNTTGTGYIPQDGISEAYADHDGSKGKATAFLICRAILRARKK